MYKKIALAVVGLAFVASPLLASASTLSDLLAQVESLLSRIKALQQSTTTSSPGVMCTMEVKQCPDGSYVSRGGPNCEFAACSGATVVPAPPSRVCPQILRSLSRGSMGDDVRDLQSYLGVSATGYFGPLTVAAVMKFQTSEGLSQVGIVGPLTRAAFARRCGNPLPESGTFSASPMRGVAPLSVNFTFVPKTDDAGQYYVEFGDGEEQLMDLNQIYCIRAPCISPSVASHTYAAVGTYTVTVSRYFACLYSNPRCMMAQPAPLATLKITVTSGEEFDAPSISGVDGPTTLRVNQQGTWSVHVTDPSGYLSYSVRWGDEVPVPPSNGTAASQPTASSGTFTHTYSTAGTYTPTFTVKNGNGQSATASASVLVGDITNQTFSATPTSGAAPLSVRFFDYSVGCGGGNFTLTYGDSQSDFVTLPADGCNAGLVRNHTYTVPGVYTATLSYTDWTSYWFKSTPTIGTVTITVAGTTNTNPSISVIASPSSVAQGSAPIKKDGGALSISWSSQNGPSDSAVALWLMKTDGTNLGLIPGPKSVSGNYMWQVPGMSCDSSGTCSVIMDSPYVYATNPGNYYIVAKLYTPANAYLGGYPPPNPTYPTNLATSNSATFTITSH